MTERETMLAVIDTFDALAIPYILVGSFSSSFYSVPRSTKDADFVIELGARSVRELADHLGPQFSLDPQMSFETVTMTRRHQLTVVETAFKIELFYLSDDAHDQERFHRRPVLQPRSIHYAESQYGDRRRSLGVRQLEDLLSGDFRQCVL